MISTNEQLLSLVNNAPADIQARMSTQTFRQGDTLISQGHPPEKIAILKDGLAKVCILEANGKEFSIAFVGKGELLGEIEVFLGHPFTCSVTVLKDTSAYRLSKHLFLEWMERDRKFNRLVVQELASRLYTLSTRTSFQMVYPLEYAIMKLLYLSQEEHVDISKTDLADYLGITIRSLNRSLKQLNEKGILQFADKTLRVCSQEKLKQELLRHEYA